MIERLYITSSSEVVDFAEGYHLLATGGRSKDLPGQGAVDLPEEGTSVPEITSLRDAVDAYEKQLVLSMLEACEGNVSKAADKLGPHKSVLYRKLDKYRQKGAIKGQA